VVGQLPAGHPDCQRQVPAQRGQLDYPRIAGGDVGPAGQVGQPGLIAQLPQQPAEPQPGLLR
jgi:hypothetical protein